MRFDRARGCFLMLLMGGLLVGAACSSNDTASSPSPDTTGTVAARLADAALATRVRKVLLDTLALRAFDIEVEARQGRVALRGTVGTDAQRTLAASLARQVHGVRHLLDSLIVSNSLALPGEVTNPE